MKRILYNNPAVTTTTTDTDAALAYGDTDITVDDASSFSADDILLIESVGNEFGEIRIVDSITNNTITLTVAIEYPHISGVTVTKLSYNQYKITYSNTNNDFEALVTGDLDYADKHNRIDYVTYTNGVNDNTYLAIYYYNSVTEVEILQDTLYQQDNYSWCTEADFKSQIGITTSSNSEFIYEALRHGVESMGDDLFFNKVVETTDADVQFDIDLAGYVVADFDGNRLIDKNDIIAYEYDTANNLITYISHKIVKLFNGKGAPKVIFSERVPTSGKTLVITIPVAQVEYDSYRSSYSEINKLYAVNYLLNNSTNKSVKDAIMGWSAGGTTIDKGPTTTADVIEKNDKRIRMLMKDLLQKAYVKPTKLRTQRSILNARSRSNTGVRTPSGNVYY